MDRMVVSVLHETGMIAAKLNQKKKRLVLPRKNETKVMRMHKNTRVKWDHLLSFSCLRHLSRGSDPTKEIE